MKNILCVDQINWKFQSHKPFTGLFSDPSPSGLIVNAVDFDEGEALLSVMGLTYEIELEARVSRPEIVLNPPQGEGAVQAVWDPVCVGHLV